MINRRDVINCRAQMINRRNVINCRARMMPQGDPLPHIIDRRRRPIAASAPQTPPDRSDEFIQFFDPQRRPHP